MLLNLNTSGRGKSHKMLKIVFGCALLAVLVSCCRAATAESAQPTEATNTTNSTQLFFNMTEAEVKAEYLRRFRGYCRNATACRNPIVEVINGTLYNMTIQICLWSTPYKNCPYLCVNSKQIECLGKPFNPGCAYECYPKCNGTHPKLSEPFGSYWTICNTTDEEMTTTVQPSTATTAGQQTVKQPATKRTTTPNIANPSKPGGPSEVVPVPGRRPPKSEKERNGDSAVEASPLSLIFATCGMPIGLSIIIGVILGMIVGVAFSEKIKALLNWCAKHCQGLCRVVSHVGPNLDNVNTLLVKCDGCGSDTPNDGSFDSSQNKNGKTEAFCQKCIDKMEKGPEHTKSTESYNADTGRYKSKEGQGDLVQRQLSGERKTNNH